MCPKGPVIEIPHEFDIMLHTRNCKHLHEYLNKDRFDVARLNKMLEEEFGELVNKTKTHLQEYFNTSIGNIREYFTLLDARIAELYHLENPLARDLQRQECFILANNFVGPDPTHANMFVSRLLTPMHVLFDNIISNDKNHR